MPQYRIVGYQKIHATSLLRNQQGRDAMASLFNFVDAIDQKDREDLMAVTQTRVFAKGASILWTDEGKSFVYFVYAGRIKVCQYTFDGREVILWLCLPGETLGHTASLPSLLQNISAEACEATIVKVIKHDQFKAYLADHPEAALVFLQTVALRMHGLGDVFTMLALDDIDTRLGKFLIYIGSIYGTITSRGIQLDLKLTQQEIASMIGATRQSVCSSLSKFRKSGALDVQRHGITITDVHSLARTI